MYPLFFLTVILLFGVGLVFAQTDRQEVMAHWDKRRCDLPVIIASNLYKPADDSRSTTQFATENLKFCTNKIITEVFTVALNPFLAVLGEQLKFTRVLEESMANVKGSLGRFFSSFSTILGGIYQRFIEIGFNFRKTLIMFMTAMNRVFAIAIASLFSGMSALISIQNLVDAVIKIVLIVLAVLAGLVVILFLAFFPVIPIIFTTIAVMVAGAGAGFASAGDAGGLSGVFCFSPDTEIQTARGLVTIGEIRLNDILQDGGKVEGILRVNGSATDLFMLKGVRVSGDHLIYYEPLGGWISVRDHPGAKPQIKREPVLICLNTSTREIPIQGIRFRDWEELDPLKQEDWNKVVASMLHSTSATEASQYPLFSGDWLVQTTAGSVALKDIRMGDTILDISGALTTVLGVYTGIEEIDRKAESFWTTDSIWWSERGSWIQRPVDKTTGNTSSLIGFHLITDSGTFMVVSGEEHKGAEKGQVQGQGQGQGVRDFTEVGQMRIAETYEWMKQRL